MVGRAVGQGIIAVFFHVPAIHFRFDLAVGDSCAADCCLHVGMTGAVQGKMTENAVPGMPVLLFCDGSFSTGWQQEGRMRCLAARGWQRRSGLSGFWKMGGSKIADPVREDPDQTVHGKDR